MRNVRWMTAVAAAGGILEGSAVTTLAQAPAPTLQQPSPVVTSGRSYYFECGLVVVLFGAALYAVCRGSFRR